MNDIHLDVENAGGEVIYDGDQTKDIVVDGNLISAAHPDFTDLFMEAILNEMEKNQA
jgi:hypothetical protein